MKALANKSVYLVVTGARKASIMPELVKELTEEGASVYTFFTEMARKISNPADFEIPGNKVSLDYSRNGQEIPLEDIVLVVPTTFNTLNKVANGIADNYPTTIVASAIGKKKNVIFAPAMNRSFWDHPITSKSIETLQRWGCQVVWPEITPEKVTMAPLEKIADTTYNCFSKIRYDSERLPIDNDYCRAVGENFSEFRAAGESLLDGDFVKGSAGFISKRVNGGILVSSTGSNIGSLAPDDLALVTAVKDGKVFWKGEHHPSSEVPIIYELHESMPEAGALIHTHARKITYNHEMQKYASSVYLRYGKFGEARKVLEALRGNDGFGIMKLHGELCTGADLYDAFRKLRERFDEAK
ncbi:MAG: flavoprotein [archaeon]